MFNYMEVLVYHSFINQGMVVNVQRVGVLSCIYRENSYKPG